MVYHKPVKTGDLLKYSIPKLFSRVFIIFFIGYLILGLASFNILLENQTIIDSNKQYNNYQLINFEDCKKSDITLEENGTRAQRGFFDTWGMTSPDLNDPDDPNKQSIYAMYRPYTFRFTIDPQKFANVSFVTLELEDEGINHTWSRARSVRNIQDTQPRSASITSSFYLLYIDLGFLDFNITYDWKPKYDTLTHRFNITIIDNISQVSKTSVWINYRVIRHLKFAGNLKTESTYQGEIAQNDWVRNGEEITWTGLKVIYNSSLNLKVPQEQGTITVYDDDGEYWEDISGTSEDMKVISQVDPKNDLKDEHTINLTGPAKNNLIAPIKFIIRVDGDGITFFNSTPKPNYWVNSTGIDCKTMVADNLTSGVDVESIEIAFSVDNGRIWSDWQKPKINLIDDPKIVECYRTINFLEGEVNLIKWRGRDLVGTLKSSDIYSVKVDTKPISFKDPKPKARDLLYSTKINCSIEIFDPTSGVDKGSIQYSIFRDGENVWTYWKVANLNSTQNKNLVNPYIVETFNYGKDNFIKWRAKDVAGNGFEVSPEYQILVTHEMPKIHLISPIPGVIVNITKPTLIWNHSYEILQNVQYQLEYWSSTDPANITNISVSEMQYTPPKPLIYNTKYYWRVTPFADELKGVSDSGIWNFTIDTVANINPEFGLDIIISPSENVQISSGEKIELDLLLYNKGNRNDVYQIEVLANPVWNNSIDYPKIVYVPVNGTLSEKIIIHAPASGLKDTNYQARLKITSLGAQELNLTVIETKILTIQIIEKEENEMLLIWIFEIISVTIIIMVILSAIWIFRKKEKYKEFEYKPPAKEQVEIVFKPKHSKAIDGRSKKPPRARQ